MHENYVADLGLDQRDTHLILPYISIYQGEIVTQQFQHGCFDRVVATGDATFACAAGTWILGTWILGSWILGSWIIGSWIRGLVGVRHGVMPVAHSCGRCRNTCTSSQSRWYTVTCTSLMT